jgi:nucleotide-binding universal stress UspA family protein
MLRRNVAFAAANARSTAMSERQMSPEQLVLNPPRRAVERMLDLDSGKKPARLLFATSAERPSADAVQHACDFAQALGAEMHVLYVASEPGRATQIELASLDMRATRATGPAVLNAKAAEAAAMTETPAEVMGPSVASPQVDVAAHDARDAHDATLATVVTTSRGADAEPMREALVPPIPEAAPTQADAADRQSADQSLPSAQSVAVEASSASDAPTQATAAASSTIAPAGVTNITPSWCNEIFPEELRSTRVTVRSGDFASTVCEHAEALGASLIIVSGYERPGGRVTALARAAAVPVFVSRARGTDDTTILAATDLTDEQYPILRLAYKLGGLTQAPLVAVHNVAPKTLQLPVRASARAVVAPDPAIVTKRLEALVDVTRKLGFETAVLSSMFDPVDAILREAKARYVDTIVVGTRAPLPGERGSVAAQVINLATQSVLVIPLEPLEPSNASRALQAPSQPFAIESSV